MPTSGCLISRPTTIAAPWRSGGWPTSTKSESCSWRRATAYLDLQARFPDIHLNGARRPGDRRRAGRRRARSARLRQLVADRPQPPTPVPLVRRWHWQAPTEPVDPGDLRRGVAPSLDAGRMFLVDKTALRLLDPSTGAVALVVRAGTHRPSGPATWPTS